MTYRIPTALKRALIGTLLAGSLGLIGLYAYYPLKGIFNRLFRMPSVVDQPFVSELQETNGLGQRKQFLEAWRAGRNFGLHRRVSSVEGDPIHLWLITEEANLTLVTDFTRDTNSVRTITVGHPVAITLCEERGGDPFRAWFPRLDETYLCLVFANGNDAHF